MSRDKQQCPTGCVCVGGQGESDARPSAAWGAVSQSLWLTKCRSQGPALIQMEEGGLGICIPQCAGGRAQVQGLPSCNVTRMTDAWTDAFPQWSDALSGGRPPLARLRPILGQVA